MSSMDLNALIMHRRLEMGERISNFLDKCDQAIEDVKKLKVQAEKLVNNLDCHPSELKENFLNSMKQLDEYTYIITDFTLAMNNVDSVSNGEITPTHLPSTTTILQPIPAFNLMDTLSEPVPSTSKEQRLLCSNKCKEKRPCRKVPKQQLLIAFSSTSCSSESLPVVKNEEVQVIAENVKKLTLDDSNPIEEHNLPAQAVLQVDDVYPAKILFIDGMTLWIITDDISDFVTFLHAMKKYYKENLVELRVNDLMTLSNCVIYDPSADCYQRALLMRLNEETSQVEVFLLDVGQTKEVSTLQIQPLIPKFAEKPPFARCCHLAGIDLNIQLSEERITKLEKYIQAFARQPCRVKIEDNSSESLEVIIFRTTGESLNELLIVNGLAIRNSSGEEVSAKGLPELDNANVNVTDCPEYEDPVEAVTGYRNRDEMDICKNYKGGLEKTCFKGSRCTKKHVKINSDGWTLDKVDVPARCKSVPLPPLRTWVTVYVTYVAHFDRFYGHLRYNGKRVQETKRKFGVVLPPATLDDLVIDMNCPATRMAYKPLKLMPSPGELVAALYRDEQWYRAKVISATRVDQNVEVFYIDYGNVLWVKEDAIRELDPRYCVLEAQAVKCALAGVVAKSPDSRQWAAAKAALTELIHERTLQAHVIACEYDEIVVELFDADGFNIAEQLAASNLVTLEHYSATEYRSDKQRLLLP